VKGLSVGGAKISIDFMEGQVRGRSDEQVFFVSDEFLSKISKIEMAIAGEVFEVYVPDYTDYLLLKLMSARPSDVRDIATLVWKRGIPENLRIQAKKMLAYPEVIDKNLPLIISDVADKRFLDSWKGTFVTTEFTELIKENVISALKKL
ncbi:MAG: nucleotidyltransferase, partial [Nitrososphaerota archaeon]|nr:nucleotidyltransferase [Nitrososphaerota archaeon]